MQLAARIKRPSLLYTLLSGLGYLVARFRDEVDDPIGLDEYKSNSLLYNSYDFIVVGGGSAGSIVAARLSENPNVTVLLLEAGGDGTLASNVPMMQAMTLHTEIDWNYKGKRDNVTCLGMTGKQCAFHRGKAIGGTSTLNVQIYIRGHPHDYYRWAKMGNYNWTYEDVLPFFKKSEDMLDTIAAKDTRHHSTGGPFGIEYPAFRTKLADLYLDAAVSAGYKRTKDVNGDQMEGFNRFHYTARNGRREDSGKAFLRGAKDRPNLTVILRAVVSKVLLEGRRAVGVRVQRFGRTIDVKADKEVVLSAGVFASPQILMLSGIGPKDHLEQMSIPVVADLPVGLGLNSHFGAMEPTFLVDDYIGYDFLQTFSPVSLAKYVMFGSGPLTVPSLTENIGFLRSGLADASDPRPDIMLIMLSGSIGTDGATAFGDYLGLDKKQRQRFDELSFGQGFTTIAYFQHPLSRGRVYLQSTDINDHPIIEHNIYTDPEDMRRTLAGIRAFMKVSLSEPLSKHGSRPFYKPVVGCEAHAQFSDAYLECAARTIPFNFNHDTSTCRMGPKGAEGVVVDPELRVHGIEGLRVADASVMPEVTTGNIVAVCMMIGERAADFIKKEHDLA